MIAIIDYDAGNIKSVEKAIENGLKELNKNREEVEITVITIAKTNWTKVNFLGFTWVDPSSFLFMFFFQINIPIIIVTK